MALKLALFVFLVIAVVAAPLPTARAQSQPSAGLLDLFLINGTVFCSVNGSIGANGTVFPNAVVQLQCTAGNIIVSTAITNGSGVFSFVVSRLELLRFLVTSPVAQCNLVVATPLVTCNANLPPVGLQSPLQQAGTVIRGIFRIINLVPTGFVPTPAT